MGFLKSLVEFGALGSTAVCVLVCNNRLAWKRPVPLPSKRIGSVLLSLFVLLAFFWLLNGPSLLSTTHDDVVRHKAEGRAKCRVLLANGDEAGAEKAVRDNSVGKELSMRARKSQNFTMERVLQRVMNVLLFGMGVMYAVAPFLLLLFLEVFAGVRLLSAKSWSLVMPVVNVVTAYGIATYLCFYLFVDGVRVSSCLLVSGHWFMYVLTTVACVVVMVHFLSADEGPGGPLATGYALYCALYQGLVLRVLITTQKYYHDSDEACAAILWALICTPVLILLVAIVEIRMRNRRVREDNEDLANIRAKLVDRKTKGKGKKKKKTTTKDKKHVSKATPTTATISDSDADGDGAPLRQAPSPPSTTPTTPVKTTPASPPDLPPRPPPELPPREDETASPLAANSNSFLGSIQGFNRACLKRKEESERKERESVVERDGGLASLLSSKLDSLRGAVGLGDEEAMLYDPIEEDDDDSDCDDWEE